MFTLGVVWTVCAVFSATFCLLRAYHFDGELHLNSSISIFLWAGFFGPLHLVLVVLLYFYENDVQAFLNKPILKKRKRR